MCVWWCQSSDSAVRKSSAAGAASQCAAPSGSVGALTHLVGDFKQRYVPAAATIAQPRPRRRCRPKGSIVLSLETYLQPEDLKVTSFEELNCSKILPNC